MIQANVHAEYEQSGEQSLGDALEESADEIA